MRITQSAADLLRIYRSPRLKDNKKNQHTDETSPKKLNKKMITRMSWIKSLTLTST